MLLRVVFAAPLQRRNGTPLIRPRRQETIHGLLVGAPANLRTDVARLTTCPQATGHHRSESTSGEKHVILEVPNG